MLPVSNMIPNFTQAKNNIELKQFVRYGVTIRIQSEYGKIRIRKNSVFGYFHAVTMSSYEAKLETLCKKSIKELTEKTIQKLFPRNRNSL